MIHDAQMDFYGTRLATCSSDRIIKIFDVKVNTTSGFATTRVVVSVRHPITY